MTDYDNRRDTRNPDSERFGARLDDNIASRTARPNKKGQRNGMARSTRDFRVDHGMRRDAARLAQRLAETLHDVDMTGVGEIPTHNPFEGRENTATAVLTGLQPPPPGGLLAAYEAWKEHQAQAESTVTAAKAQADATEARAFRKSRKRLRKALSSGMSAPQACALAHRHYRAKGGRSGFGVWARRVAQGG